MSAEKEKSVKFEEALQRLEEIVKLMESGEADLDQMLQLFEEGQTLSKQCAAKLNEVEQKIEKITGVDADGEVLTEDFTLQAD